MSSRKGHGRRRARGGAASATRSSATRLVVGGPHAVRAALESGCRVDVVFVEEGAGRRADAVAAAARERSVRVNPVGRGECDRLAGVRSQGVAAEIEFAYADLDSLIAEGDGLIVFLDGIEDPHNLGAIVRTADAAGVAGVVIPARRSAGVTSAVVRASAGAALSVPVARAGNLVQALRSAREQGIWIVGLAQDGERLLEAGPPPTGRQGLVVGGEGPGLGRLVGQNCDEIARLPMVGEVESLNASVAAALAIYRLCEKRLFRS